MKSTNLVTPSPCTEVRRSGGGRRSDRVAEYWGEEAVGEGRRGGARSGEIMGEVRLALPSGLARSSIEGTGMVSLASPWLG